MNNQNFDIQSLLPVGQMLQGGKYRVERYLSSGNFGNTYIVTNLMFDEQLAMKEFFLRGYSYRTNSGMQVAVSPSANPQNVAIQREKFKKEALRMRGLTNPHLVHIHDLFEENGTVYYVMDYVRGESLASYMERQGGPLTEEQVRYILDQVLDGLEEVHQKQIWHLDLKPDNIMIDNQGKVVIIDFGASKQLGQSGQYTGTTGILCYTPGYAPIEQMSQDMQNIGPWTDLYALGATLYNLLTGTTPSLQSPDKLAFPPAVSNGMRRLIAWMLQLNVQDRPRSVAQIRDYLRKVVGAQAVPFNNAVPQKPTEAPVADDDEDEGDAPTDKRKWIIGASAAAAVLVAVLLIVFMGKKKTDDGLVSQLTVSAESLDPAVLELVRNMVYVEGGTFTMGAPYTDSDTIELYDYATLPAHQVTLSSFYISRYEVTQAAWMAVMGTTPSTTFGYAMPVDSISWVDCQEFVERLNSMTGIKFRLPTEAEWEFAARGGVKSRGTMYAGSDNLDDVAWYDKVGDFTPYLQPVGMKLPNELGLYDMTGNVLEWCEDTWYEYEDTPQVDPVHQEVDSMETRILRGGYYEPGTHPVWRRFSASPFWEIVSGGLRVAV